MSKPAQPLVVVDRISRVYMRGKIPVEVFRDLSFTIGAGEFVAILGPSGSGKTTILNLLAGFDRPTSGAVVVDGVTLSSLEEQELVDWRLRNLGFVFQSRGLCSLLNARENVEFPLRRLVSAADRRKRAERALALVGLAERGAHFPSELSGGEEQRVGIARAIVTDPKLIIADEPTGNLDVASAEQVMSIFERLNREQDKTIVLVTHDPNAAKFAQRRIMLEKGVLEPGTEPGDDPAAPMAAHA